MGQENPLAAFGRYLHQDVARDASTPSELATTVLAMMRPEERTALRVYLSSALERLTPAELKGELNRADGDWRFSSSGTIELLRAAAKQLGAEA